LNTSEYNEGDIVLGLGEADACTEEYKERAGVCYSTTSHIRNWTPEAWCYSLENKIGCDGQVDKFQGYVEIFCNGW
jgi:hypothetical protein